MSKENYLERVKQYREQISYLFFGVLTTGINFVIYTAAYEWIGIDNLTSVVLAWIGSVLFAYITNKIWVFQSKTQNKIKLIRESLEFFAARLLTGGVELGIMYVCVDLWSWNGMFMKLISSVLIIILNYILSKLVVFRKQK